MDFEVSDEEDYHTAVNSPDKSMKSDMESETCDTQSTGDSNNGKIPIEVQIAIDNFKMPEFFHNKGFKPATNTNAGRSLLYDYGVVAVSDGGAEKVWFCQAESQCRNEDKAISITGNTSGATRHLNKVHLLLSAKTKLQTTRRMSMDNNLDELSSSMLFRNDQKRFHEYQFALLVVENQMSFSSVTTASARNFFNLSCLPEMNASYCVKVLKRRILEMYSSVKSQIVCKIQEAIQFYGYGIINLNIDLWQPKTGGYAGSKKYLGIRIYFIN